MTRDYTLFVKDILEAIKAVEKFVEKLNYKEFLKDEKTKSAVVWKIQVIGEAAKNIPKSMRDDYEDLPFPPPYLNYLNVLERLNCDYCSYFNGLASYVMEIAARTGQYWRPIRHAPETVHRHSRAHRCVDCGDAEAYRNRRAEIRQELRDLASEQEYIRNRRTPDVIRKNTAFKKRELSPQCSQRLPVEFCISGSKE